MRAGIYGRNSAGKAKSITAQLKMGRAAIGEQAWTPAGEYSDGTSASQYRTQERKDWPRLLADITGGVLDVLVVWETSRASRDVTDWEGFLQLCKAHGVLIFSTGDDQLYDPRKAKDLRDLRRAGADNAYETDLLSRRVTDGIRDTATNPAGAGPHGRPSYGQAAVYDAETGRPGRVPNADAAVVREIFTRLAKYTPVSTLTKDLNARGIPAPHGGKWERKTVRIVATNLAYIGQRRYQGEVYRAQWEPIVDVDQFQRVQAILADPARMKTKPGRFIYLLSGITSTPCGGRLRGHPEKGRPPRYLCEADSCVSIRMDEADEIVERVVLERLARPDAREAMLRRDEKAAEASREAARLKLRLEDARRSFDSPDGISADALARLERTLIPLIEDAERRARPAGVSGVVADALEAPDPARLWAGLPVAGRRELVKAFASVKLGKFTRRMGAGTPRDVRLLEALTRLSESTWSDGTRWGLS